MSEHESVLAARDQLLSGGRISDRLRRAVPPAILQSWRRSLRSGARPDNPTLVYRGEHHAQNALCIAADPVLSRLAEQLSGLEAGVLLTDQNANIVRRWVSDSTIRPMMDRIHSDIGFCVSEETIGTNGVGSVIEQDTALQISGPEHLAPALQNFTCVGVPIHNPITRRLDGVVTMNCRAVAGNPLLTPLMTSTVQEVESRILARATMAERQLLDEYLVAIGSRRAPIAAVGQDIFIAGPKVTELLEGIDRAQLWEHVRRVAAGSREDAQELLTTERFRIARCRAVHRDDQVVGALVEFDVAPARARSANEESLRPTLAIPGRSASLANSIAHATRLASRGIPILIEGESGVGKHTMAKALLASTGAASELTTTIDAAIGWTQGVTGFVNVLRHELELQPEAVVLRHIECLAPEAAAASASILESLDADGRLPRLITTLTRGSHDQPAGLRRLIDTVGVGRVTLKPLRDRRDDIAPAAVELLRKHAGDRRLHFSSAALRYLMRAPWPGNMRQLDATVRGVASTAMGPEIGPTSLPSDFQGNSRKRELNPMEELELGAILQALQRHGGNKVAAAQSIGISRSTLYRRLRAYHVDPDRQYF